MRKIKIAIDNPKYADVLDILGVISAGICLYGVLFIGCLFS